LKLAGLAVFAQSSLILPANAQDSAAAAP